MDLTRYEEAFAQGGQSALVQLALSDQAALAGLVNRKQRELETAQTGEAAARAERDALQAKLDQISAMTKITESKVR